MMEKKDNTDSAIKKALRRRDTYCVPPNFACRMMEKVHREAAKKRKRQAILTGLSFGAALAFIVGLAVYTLFFRLKLDPRDYISALSIDASSLSVLGFYGFIGILVLLLLAFDYWLRKALKRKKHKNSHACQ